MWYKLLGFLPTLFSGAKEYIAEKQEIQKLEKTAAIELKKVKLTAEIERAKSNDAADTTLDKISLETTGWMDDYLVVITTFPFVMIMLSPFIDMAMMFAFLEEPTYTTGMIQRAVFDGFLALNKAPEWYWWLLGAVYLRALGMRRMLRIFLEKGFNPFKK